MAFPTGWGRRCELVIQASQVTNNEVNFPLLVTEETLPSEIFDADGSYPALDGGGDIRFSLDEAGNTQLACEIEQFVTDNNPANGKASIWVKVPSLSSSTNTTIYIWYNKAGESQPAETDAYGKHAVWDSNYKMVQHMNQDPSGSAPQMIDSTSNSNDGTSAGTMTSSDQVAGQIDGSLDFDGVNDYINIDSSNNDINTDKGTISGWFYTTTWGGATSDVLISYRVNADNNIEIYRLGGTNDFKSKYKANGTTKELAYTASISNWYNIILSWDKVADEVKSFINGSQNGATLTGLGSWVGSINIGRLGAARSPAQDFCNGIIDEIRISIIARTDGWNETEYNNQNTPSTFIIEGTPESPGAPPPSFIPQIIIF